MQLSSVGIQWYVNHLNWPDKWGLYGTTYDYDYNNGVATSRVNADSTDSYAATFLTLAWAFYPRPRLAGSCV